VCDEKVNGKVRKRDFLEASKTLREVSISAIHAQNSPKNIPKAHKHTQHTHIKIVVPELQQFTTECTLVRRA
jgi:hypothetical protein